jgi:hypothetical protein
MPIAPLIWRIDAYSITGDIIGTLEKHAGGPIILHGTPDALDFVLPDLARLPQYFQHPEERHRLAYTAFTRAIGPVQPHGAPWPSYEEAPATWPTEGWIPAIRAVVDTLFPPPSTLTQGSSTTTDDKPSTYPQPPTSTANTSESWKHK